MRAHGQIYRTGLRVDFLSLSLCCSVVDIIIQKCTHGSLHVDSIHDMSTCNTYCSHYILSTYSVVRSPHPSAFLGISNMLTHLNSGGSGTATCILLAQVSQCREKLCKR